LCLCAVTRLETNRSSVWGNLASGGLLVAFGRLVVFLVSGISPGRRPVKYVGDGPKQVARAACQRLATGEHLTPIVAGAKRCSFNAFRSSRSQPQGSSRSIESSQQRVTRRRDGNCSDVRSAATSAINRAMIHGGGPATDAGRGLFASMAGVPRHPRDDLHDDAVGRSCPRVGWLLNIPDSLIGVRDGRIVIFAGVGISVGTG
jgi:hypothetical protein